MIKKCFFYFIIISFCFSQTHTISLNDILEYVDLSEVSAHILEKLDYLLENPVEISDLKGIDKEVLFFVSEETIDAIIYFYEQNKNISDLNNLYEIKGINLDELKLILPFITLNSDKFRLKNIKINSRNRFIYEQTGKNKNYNLISIKNNYFSIKSVFDNYTKNSYSFYNTSLLINITDKINLHCGSYKINFGYGLNLWGPFKQSKSIYYNSISSKKSKIYSANSYSANGILNGVVLSHTYNNFELKTFLYENFNNYGAILSFNDNNFISEFLLLKNGSAYNGSLGCKLSLNNIRLDGEFSVNNGGFSFITSLKYKISNSINLFYSIRNYRNLFNNSLSNPFRESSSLKNEKGEIFCINLRFGKIKNTLWLEKFSYQNKIGSELWLDGEEINNKLDIKLFKFVTLTNKTSFEKKEEISEGILSYKKKIKSSSDVYFKINKNLDLKINLSFSKLINSGNINYSCSGLIKYKFSKNLKITSVITLFDSQAKGTSIYLYEYDLPGTFSINNYSGDGFRFYLMVRYNILQQISLSLKYSIEEEVENNIDSWFSKKKNDFRFQLDLKI